MRFGLSEATIKRIHDIFDQYPVIDQVIIYGSRAKGHDKIGSDIDLTLCGDRITHQDFLEIFRKLDELSIPYTIDLSIFTRIDNPDLKAHIQRVGKLFYTKPGDNRV